MHEMRTEDEIEIDLRELIGVLLSKIWIIALCAIATGLIGLVISKFCITPMYESTTKVYVLNKNDDATVTYNDMQLASQFVKDYPELIKSRYVLEAVIDEFELDESYKSLYERVTVSTSDSRIISIKVKDANPHTAKLLVDRIREVSAERIKSVMDVEAVNVVDEGNYPAEPSEPSVFKNTLIAAVLGGFVCAGVIIVLFLLDDTIKTSDDVEKYLGLSVLGMIPDGDTSGNKKKKKKKKK